MSLLESNVEVRREDLRLPYERAARARVAGYPQHPQFVPSGQTQSGKYTTRFAQSLADLDRVLRLRFQIFNEELGEGLDASVETGRDEDAFDAQCHHLMVVATETDELVGTYRMQTHEMATAGIGFYTGGEFDLGELPQDVLQRGVELGRACIAAPHRNGRVLFLLWKGLMRYLLTNNKAHLFGCCSLTSQDPEEGLSFYRQLRGQNHLHPQVDLPPQPDYRCELPPDHVFTAPVVSMPRLMRVYLNYGAKICSGPAIDRQFKTIDYVACLSIEDLDAKTFDTFANP